MAQLTKVEASTTRPPHRLNSKISALMTINWPPVVAAWPSGDPRPLGPGLGFGGFDGIASLTNWATTSPLDRDIAARAQEWEAWTTDWPLCFFTGRFHLTLPLPRQNQQPIHTCSHELLKCHQPPRPLQCEHFFTVKTGTGL